MFHEVEITTSIGGGVGRDGGGAKGVEDEGLVSVVVGSAREIEVEHNKGAVVRGRRGGRKECALYVAAADIREGDGGRREALEEVGRDYRERTCSAFAVVVVKE